MIYTRYYPRIYADLRGFFLTSDFTDLTDVGYAGLGVETGRVRGCFIRVIRVISGSIKKEVLFEHR